LPAIAIPALIVLFLPARIMFTYVDVVEPLSLFIGSLLALYVSFTYRKQLKAAFVFLSAFLFIYMLAIILFLSFSPVLLPYLETRLGDAEIFALVQTVQFINYAMLLFFCISLLRVANVTKLNRNVWVLFALTFISCILAVFLAIYPVLDLFKTSSSIGLPAVFSIMMRILDATLIVFMVPVLWLYVQYLKSRQEQSLTITVIMLGIVCATVFDYLFESITKLFPQLLPEGSHLYTAIPEMLFIYGYLMIAAGLCAHHFSRDRC